MLEEIISRFGREQEELIHILHRVHGEFGYIPPEAISLIARHLRISESEVFGVLTFYRAFSLEPRGKYVITVCLGTACHVRGGVQVAEELERRLGIKAGQTTPDRKYSLETVNCLGCCAIGPVVVVNGKYYSNVAPKKIDKIIREYQTAS
jgi:NADH-quinone oxidoreductase subunit E